MKQLCVLALTILLVAMLGSARMTHAEKSAAAEDHMVMHSADQRSDRFAPDTWPLQDHGSLNCQVLCGAIAEVHSVRPVPRQMLWHHDVFVMGLGVLSTGIAPEVAERPPKKVFV
ncbi:hypothetical protein ACSBLW_00415 [Thioclava sp. FR2]|uniref:hypothetical protein n=1 Tax=Thioclava sp. FR2 TaxID=3445780 RepID=UPI003EB819AE